MDALPQSAWAGGEDVCTKFEDSALKAACQALGVAAEATPTDWRALRTAKLDAMCAVSPRLADVPLATLPEGGTIPFVFKSSAEHAVAEKQAAEMLAEEARLEKKRKLESDE